MDACHMIYNIIRAYNIERGAITVKLYIYIFVQNILYTYNITYNFK